nr:MarR family transcriptional regulator [Vibrio cyclitrophicus]
MNRLKVTASQKGLKLLKKKHSDSCGILVSSAFTQPQLSSYYSNLLSETLTFCKKYEGLKPQNIEELVRYCGGLKATVNNIQHAYVFELSVRFDDELEFLLYAIESALIKAISVTNQTQKWLSYEVADEKGILGTYNAQYNIHLPMCALCWKRTNSFSFYCNEHNSIRNKKSYNSAVRKVFSFTTRHSSNTGLTSFANGYTKKNGKQRRLATKLFGMVNDTVLPVFNVLSYLTETHWKSYAETIIIYTKNHYPTSFHRLDLAKDLRQFSAYDSLLDWGYMVIDCLDNSGNESSSWKSSQELIHLNNDQLRLTLLHILARYEATQRIYQPLKSGPMKGYGVDIDKREILTELYNNQIRENGHVNLSQIAREMKLSRQRVSVLAKNLKLGN